MKPDSRIKLIEVDGEAFGADIMLFHHEMIGYTQDELEFARQDSKELQYPFGAISNPDDNSYDIYQRAMHGEFGEVKIIEMEKLDPKIIVRQYRDSFLSATDRMTVIDYTIADLRLTEEERED